MVMTTFLRRGGVASYYLFLFLWLLSTSSVTTAFDAVPYYQMRQRSKNSLACKSTVSFSPRVVVVPSVARRQQRHALDRTTTITNASRLLSLPSCGPGQQWSVVVGAGVTSALLQRILANGLSRRLPWVQQRKNDSTSQPDPLFATYTAHSIVALALMLLLSTGGVMGWWRPGGFAGSSGGAVLENASLFRPSSSSTVRNTSNVLGQSGIARWMAAVVLGSFSMWDIPTSWRVPALRKPDVLIHHLVMMGLALVGCTLLPMPYIVYYFGVAEVSSIPIVLYDQFTEWMKQPAQQKSSRRRKESLERRQEQLGVLSAVAFTLVRVVSFTHVTLARFLPDIVCILRTPTRHRGGSSSVLLSPSRRLLLSVVLVGALGFCALQWYWFFQNIVFKLLSHHEQQQDEPTS